MTAGDVLPLAFVSRPPNADDLLQFDTYEGGADLKLADATLGADRPGHRGRQRAQRARPLRGPLGQDVDVRGPEWSYDGTKVVFAARPGAGERARSVDARRGGRRPARSSPATTGGWSTSVPRAQLRSGVRARRHARLRLDARRGRRRCSTFLPNSNLYRVTPTAPGAFSYDFSSPQQMTFLLNSELSPAFMQDGRVSFTAEKATPDFYQLSGRRMNWDLTDYHPLLAQRAQSTSTFDNEPAPVGRLPGGDRDPRGARPQLPAHPVGRGGAGRRAARWPRSTARSARSRPTATTSPSSNRWSSSTRPRRRPRTARRRRRTARRSRCPTARSWPRTTATSPTSRRARRDYDLVAVEHAGRHAPHAGQRRDALLRRGGARLQARRDASSSRTSRSWCSAATRQPDTRQPTA